MYFDSLQYVVFLPIVFLLFLVACKSSKRNAFLLLSSYFFYGCWNPFYLILIFISTGVDFIVGIKIHKNSRKETKRNYLLISLIANLGILFFFKYANFVFGNTLALFNVQEASNYIHDYILPVGISFYTFQTIGYSIDVYRGKVKPERNLVNFALYVSFFPQLVAGPIERASNLLPQFQIPFILNATKISNGLKLILIGLIKKIVFANSFAEYVNIVFEAPNTYSTTQILFATLLFGFQIYFDFSGYTDIARGSAKLFGIDLMENFRGPYLSSSVREFWKRWHISLSLWFKDYLYIPLGGNRVKVSRIYLNLLIVFIVTGLWHGANWTFLIWGLVHGFFIILERLGLDKLLQRLPIYISRLYTLTIVFFAWIFFRVSNWDHAYSVLNKVLFTKSITSLSLDKINVVNFAMIFILLFIATILHRIEYKQNLLAWMNKLHSKTRFILICIMILFLVLFGKFYEHAEFIYFQF